MKKVLLGFLIVVIFLGILGAILFKVFAGPTQPAGGNSANLPGSSSIMTVTSTIHDPIAFVSSCYKEYITAVLTHDDLIPTQAVLDNNTMCFTQDFMSKWGEIGEYSGIDPVFYSQSARLDWPNSIDVQFVKHGAGETTYHVTFGSGSTTYSIYVSVIAENGLPKIDMVADNIYW